MTKNSIIRETPIRIPNILDWREFHKYRIAIHKKLEFIRGNK